MDIENDQLDKDFMMQPVCGEFKKFLQAGSEFDKLFDEAEKNATLDQFLSKYPEW